jgi:hypothetical protein
VLVGAVEVYWCKPKDPNTAVTPLSDNCGGPTVQLGERFTVLLVQQSYSAARYWLDSRNGCTWVAAVGKSSLGILRLLSGQPVVRIFGDSGPAQYPLIALESCV